VTTLSVLPAYPVPGRECALTFTIAPTSNFAKVWVTSAPQGSALRAKIEASTSLRFPFESGQVGPQHPISFTPDKGGVYTFVVQEYVKGEAAFGGAYEGDPSSDQTETKAGSEVQLTLQVGQRVTQKVGKSPDTATLSLWIFGSTIRATTLAVHGERTPSLSKPGTPKASIAVESTAVQSALDPFVDADVATVLGDLGTVLSNLGTVINLHMNYAADVHNTGDVANNIPTGMVNSVSPKDLPKTVSKILAALRGHYTNDDNGHTDGITPGPDSAAFHEFGIIKKNDIIDLPIFDSVGDLETAYGALADIWRSYEAHRKSTAVHQNPDNVNVLGALPAALQLHQLFISVLASVSPAIPPTINSGVVTAVSTAGFKET